jgi:hypothetical protein
LVHQIQPALITILHCSGRLFCGGTDTAACRKGDDITYTGSACCGLTHGTLSTQNETLGKRTRTVCNSQPKTCTKRSHTRESQSRVSLSSCSRPAHYLPTRDSSCLPSQSGIFRCGNKRKVACGKYSHSRLDNIQLNYEHSLH